MRQVSAVRVDLSPERFRWARRVVSDRRRTVGSRSHGGRHTTRFRGLRSADRAAILRRRRAVRELLQAERTGALGAEWVPGLGRTAALEGSGALPRVFFTDTATT